MQEKEIAAAKPSTPSDTSPASPDSSPEGSAADKISAIRDNLYQQAQEEEEQRVLLRVAYQIKQVKNRKEHPQPTTAPPPAQSRRPGQRSKKGGLWRNVIPLRGDSGGEIARKSIFLLSMIVFLICMAMMAMYFIDLYRADKLYEDLGATYHARKPERLPVATQQTIAEEEPEEKIYSLLPGAEDLLALNDEIVGWITIPDTKVDYPVLQHLDDTPGEEYYLYRNVEREDSKPGSIFLDYRCSFDRVGEDGTLAVENSDNLIIYGHNMRDESMFGTLKYYRNDPDYYKEHPVIELNSNYETYQYKIFGYFIADAEDTTETRFEYWNAINFADEDAFYDYVNEVKRRSLRLTNVDVTYGDSLLTLSTCNSAFDTARLVIVARQVREDEDPYERIAGTIENPNIKWPSVYYLWNENTYDPDAPFVPYG